MGVVEARWSPRSSKPLVGSDELAMVGSTPIHSRVPQPLPMLSPQLLGCLTGRRGVVGLGPEAALTPLLVRCCDFRDQGAANGCRRTRVVPVASYAVGGRR
jgi:hypothetical protein